VVVERGWEFVLEAVGGDGGRRGRNVEREERRRL
jgi:hypothetical protein